MNSFLSFNNRLSLKCSIRSTFSAEYSRKKLIFFLPYTFSAIHLFLDSDSFIITYHISLVNVQINYCNNNILNFDVKQLNVIMKIYYFEDTVGRLG